MLARVRVGGWVVGGHQRLVHHLQSIERTVARIRALARAACASACGAAGHGSSAARP